METSIRLLGRITLAFLLVVSQNPLLPISSSSAENTEPTTEIIHVPIENTVAGNRIPLKAEVADPEGIKTVRAYFKTQLGKDYHFVVLQKVDGEEKSVFEQFKRLGSDFDGATFSGVLPAPATGATSIDYVIVVQNNANVVVKSQFYSIGVTPGEATKKDGSEPVQVFTEMENPPAEIAGFSDNITIDVIESTGKLGGAAMLYGALSGGGQTAAVAGGTVVATSGGFTATAMAVTAGAVVAGGAVAASGGGGGGDSSGTSASASTPTAVACPYTGNWTGRWNQNPCDPNYLRSGSWQGTVNDDCYLTAGDGTDGWLRGSINPSTGAAPNLSGDHLCGPITGSANFSNNNVSGNFGGSGVTGSFTGSR